MGWIAWGFILERWAWHLVIIRRWRRGWIPVGWLLRVHRGVWSWRPGFVYSVFAVRAVRLGNIAVIHEITC